MPVRFPCTIYEAAHTKNAKLSFLLYFIAEMVALKHPGKSH